MKFSTSFLRFVMVGMVSTLIHAAVAIGLIEGAKWHPSMANGMAFAVANCFSYIANTCWSFAAKPSFAAWQRFGGVSIIALMLTMAISGLVDTAGGPYLMGILLVVMLVPPLTYVGHRNFTYR